MSSKQPMTDQGPMPDADGKDGALPTTRSGKQSRGGGKAPRASRGTDGTRMEPKHMDEAMTDGGDGPAKGPSFAKKFGTSAMAQAVRKKLGGGSYL